MFCSLSTKNKFYFNCSDYFINKCVILKNIIIQYVIHITNLYIDWDYISEYMILNEENTNLSNKYLNWKIISKNRLIPNNIIRKYQYFIYLDLLIYNNPYFNQHDMYKDIYKLLDWDYITIKYYKNINFIRDFKNYMNWDLISSRDLSLDFIQEFSDNINWKIISMRGNLPKEFINKYITELASFDIITSNEEHYINKNKLMTIRIQRWYKKVMSNYKNKVIINTMILNVSSIYIIAILLKYIIS